MADLSEAFQTALRLIATLDPDLIGIVLLSLKVSLTAVVIASLTGFAPGGSGRLSLSRARRGHRHG